METRTNKRSYWIQPMLVVGAILVAVTMANAVASTAIRSGITVFTAVGSGDTQGYVGIANINAGDSSILGVFLPTNQTAGATLGKVQTTATVAGTLQAPRILTGSINATSGVATGSVRNITDATATTFTVTFADSVAGTGTLSSGHAVGETGYTASGQGCTVALQTAPYDQSFSGSNISGVVNDTFSAKNIVSISASRAASLGIINNAGGVETNLIFTLRGLVGVIGGAGGNNIDSSIMTLVYNQTKDTFISAFNTPDSGFRVAPWDTELYQSRVRFETGINRIFVVYLGPNDTSVSLLRQANYDANDTIALYTGTVIINDTAASGNAAPSASATSTVTASQTATAQSDSTIMSLTGVAGSFILTATSLTPTSADVVSADSATSGESHLSTPIYDYTIFNATTGAQVTSIAPGVLTITMIVRGNDTVHVVTNGFRILRQSITTGVWENYTGLAGVTVFPIGSASLTGAPAVGLSFQVNTLPGDLMAVGNIASSTPSGGGDGGTCVLDKTFGGSIFAGSFETLRSARDLALSTGLGRAFVSLYYAAGFILAIGLFGFVAKKVRA